MGSKTSMKIWKDQLEDLITERRHIEEKIVALRTRMWKDFADNFVIPDGTYWESVTRDYGGFELLREGDVLRANGHIYFVGGRDLPSGTVNEWSYPQTRTWARIQPTCELRELHVDIDKPIEVLRKKDGYVNCKEVAT